MQDNVIKEYKGWNILTKIADINNTLMVKGTV